MTTTEILSDSAELTNTAGLHARPALKLTQLAKRFASRIEFSPSADGPWTDAKSPVKVMRVKAPHGARLHFRISGGDAAEAMGAVLALVRAKFDED